MIVAGHLGMRGQLEHHTSQSTSYMAIMRPRRPVRVAPRFVQPEARGCTGRQAGLGSELCILLRRSGHG